jgi:hypothetical protein
VRNEEEILIGNKIKPPKLYINQISLGGFNMPAFFMNINSIDPSTSPIGATIGVEINQVDVKEGVLVGRTLQFEDLPKVIDSIVTTAKKPNTEVIYIDSTHFGRKLYEHIITVVKGANLVPNPEAIIKPGTADRQ